MKNYFVCSIFFVVLFAGCKKVENIVTPPANEVSYPFELNYAQYSDCHYFVNDVYADTSSDLNLFHKYYGSTIPQINPNYSIDNIEVYISANIIDTLNRFKACAYLYLPPRNSSGLYSDTLRNLETPVIGQQEVGYFRRLEEGSDYFIHRETGFITLFSEPQNAAIAVAYKNYPGNTYGEFLSEIVSNQKKILVLKLVKPANLSPDMTDAWKLKLKNIYRPQELLGQRNPQLNIYFQQNGILSDNGNGIKYLQAFGLDRFNTAGDNIPDGRFDDLMSITYLPATGDVVFPVLQPFGRNYPHNIPDGYKYQAIYDSPKQNLDTSNTKFVIKGSFIPQ